MPFVRSLRAASALAIVVAGVAVGASSVLATPSAPTVSATSTVSSGPDNGSTTQAGTGDTIHTVITPTSASLVSPVQSTTVALTGAQSLVPGSAQAPDGTTLSYSADGTTFSSDATGASFLRFSGPMAAGGNGVATALQGPLNSFTTGGGGDGYSPILTTDRVFNIWHHQQGQVDCHVIATGAECAGYPFADQVAGTTPSTGHTVIGSIDPANPDHLWYPAERNDAGHQSDIGFNCVDITEGASPASCGWVGVGTTATASFNGASYFTGGGLVGGKLYAIDVSGLVYCVDPAAGGGAGAACGGYPVNLGLPAADDYLSLALSVIGDSTRMIARTNHVGAGPGGTYASTLACLDTATGAACTGWGAGAAGLRVVNNTPNVTGTTTFAINGDVLPAQSTGTSWDSFCGSRNDMGDGSDENGVSSTLALACYSLADGAAMATPAGFDTMLPDTTSGWVFGNNYGHAATAGHRVYFSMFDYNWDNDALGCYDYSTDSVCANYPYINTALEAATNSSQGEGLSIYGVAVDATGTCVWGYGDAQTFTLGTTANPALGCASSTTSATTLPVTPANSYCGVDNSGSGWAAVALQNLPASDYTGATVTVTDSNGTVVSGFDHVALPVNQTLDISSIPKSGATAALSVELDFTGINGAAFTSNHAAVQTTWTGANEPTFCFDTVASALTCLTGPSIDTAISTVFTDEPSAAMAPVTASTSLSDVDTAATGCTSPGGGGGSVSPPSVAFTQVGGSDRDATAAMVAALMYPAKGSAGVVVLARDDVYADALTGSPLANVLGGPLLLTPTASLSAQTQAAITQVLPAGGTVICLGGVDALSPAVVSTLQGLGYQVERIAGPDRYSTAALIASKIAGAETVSHIYLATGLDFADALPAADAAGLNDGVVLLTAASSLPVSTQSWLTSHAGHPVTAIGGQAAAADPAATAIVGTDRYATAAQVASSVAPAAAGIVLATGTNFPDGLVGAVYAVHNGWSLLLVNPSATSLNAAQSSYLQGAGATVSTVSAIGGTTAVSAAASGLITAGLD